MKTRALSGQNAIDIGRIIQELFDAYKQSTPEYEMDPADIYFADETAFGPRFLRTLKGEPMGSAISCTTAAGDYVSATIILGGKSIMKDVEGREAPIVDPIDVSIMSCGDPFSDKVAKYFKENSESMPLKSTNPFSKPLELPN